MKLFTLIFIVFNVGLCGFGQEQITHIESETQAVKTFISNYEGVEYHTIVYESGLVDVYLVGGCEKFEISKRLKFSEAISFESIDLFADSKLVCIQKGFMEIIDISRGTYSSNQIGNCYEDKVNFVLENSSKKSVLINTFNNCTKAFENISLEFDLELTIIDRQNIIGGIGKWWIYKDMNAYYLFDEESGEEVFMYQAEMMTNAVIHDKYIYAGFTNEGLYRYNIDSFKVEIVTTYLPFDNTYLGAKNGCLFVRNTSNTVTNLYIIDIETGKLKHFFSLESYQDIEATSLEVFGDYFAYTTRTRPSELKVGKLSSKSETIFSHKVISSELWIINENELLFHDGEKLYMYNAFLKKLSPIFLNDLNGEITSIKMIPEDECSTLHLSTSTLNNPEIINVDFQDYSGVSIDYLTASNKGILEPGEIFAFKDEVLFNVNENLFAYKEGNYQQLNDNDILSSILHLQQKVFNDKLVWVEQDFATSQFYRYDGIEKELIGSIHKLFSIKDYYLIGDNIFILDHNRDLWKHNSNTKETILFAEKVDEDVVGFITNINSKYFITSNNTLFEIKNGELVSIYDGGLYVPEILHFDSTTYIIAGEVFQYDLQSGSLTVSENYKFTNVIYINVLHINKYFFILNGYDPNIGTKYFVCNHKNRAVFDVGYFEGFHSNSEELALFYNIISPSKNFKIYDQRIDEFWEFLMPNTDALDEIAIINNDTLGIVYYGSSNKYHLRCVKYSDYFTKKETLFEAKWSSDVSLYKNIVEFNNVLYCLTGTSMYKYLKEDNWEKMENLQIHNSNSNLFSNGSFFYYGYNQVEGTQLFKYDLSILTNSSVVETEYNHLEIYPNPAEDWIIINHKDINNSTYFIRDLSGRVVQQGMLQTSGQVDVNNLIPGLYIMTVSLKETSISQSFIRMKEK